MIVGTIGKLLVAMVIGFFLNKKGILDSGTNKKISYIVMQICFPCMILSSVSNAQSGDKSEVLKLLITGIVFYIFLPFIAWLLAKCLRPPKNEEGVYRTFFIFSNYFFMGYPVSAALYGQGSVFYLSIFHIIFNVLYYSYGVYLVTGGAGSSGKAGIKQLINNGIIASLAALILFFFSIPLPDVLTQILSFIGNIATPVSMMIIGATIGTYALKDVFYNKRLIFVTLLRLILFPVLTYYVMTWLGFSGQVRGIATITMGMPVASAVSMTSIEYSANEKLASMAVAVTTLFSIISIPVMLVMLK